MQINIQDIIPFMRDGWVAMDENGKWWWFPFEPYMKSYEWLFSGGNGYEQAIHISAMFDIAPADDWTKSLIKIDNTAREKFEKEYQNNIQKTIQELKQDD